MSAPEGLRPRTTVRHVAGRVGGALLWVTAVLGLLSVVASIAATAFGVQPLVFRSGSMSPEISAGALAFAEDVPASQVEVGDVVSVVDDDGRRVTHRVTSTEASRTDPDAVQLTLQGDANPTPDATPYTVEQVDRVVLDVPWLGHVVSWLTGPWAMFLAGGLGAAVVLILLRSPAGRRRTGAVATSVLAAVIVVPMAGPDGVAGTDAAFTDVADFEAGVLAAHRVRGFDLEGGSDACVNVGTANAAGFYGSVSVTWKVRDIRYATLWTSAGLSDGSKVDTQSAPVGSSVSTAFTSRVASATPDITPSASGGIIELRGVSRLRSASSWVSEATRVVSVDRQALATGGVRCSGAEVPPAILITRPSSGGTRAGVQSAVNTQCGTSPVVAACGTAQPSGGKTITSVQYELRRQNLFGTQCWNPALGYGYFSCGWREANRSGSNPVLWSVPGSSAYASQTGTYSLTVRTTDSAGQMASQVFTFNVTS